MKILIVDDNEKIRKMLSAVLSSLNNEIFNCRDGAEAVAKIRDINPNLILMDIKMREMDGITATKKIKQIIPGSRIIILTEYDDDVLRLKAAKAGAENYFLKEEAYKLFEFINQNS